MVHVTCNIFRDALFLSSNLQLLIPVAARSKA
jgi:hypothetical protein